MVAPLKPELISPVRGEGVAKATINFTFRYQAPNATPSGEYYFMRKKLTPTVGTLEYLTDAGTWTTVSTRRTVSLNLVDGDVYTLPITTTWTDDVYEWSMRFRNNLAEEGPTSDVEKFLPRTAPTMTLAIDDPALNSRPMVRWSTVTTSRQNSFRLAVYPKAVYDNVAFNPNDPFWQAQASWLMDAPVVSSTLFRYEVGEDLLPVADYRLIGMVEDRYGISSGWVVGPEFNTNFTPPTQPDLTFIPNAETGVMDLLISAAFNLVPAASSSFDTDVGDWIPSLNSSVAHGDGVITVTGEGMSFAEMDTAQGTFANQDTAYTDFLTDSSARATDITRAEIVLWPPGGFNDRISVVAGQSYSGVFSCRPLTGTMNARMNVRWYNAAEALISTTTTTEISCLAGVWTLVPTGAMTAPVGAVKATLEIEAVCPVDGVYEVDNVAFARSDSVVWSPGGLSVDLKFIIQKRVGDGDWEYVWSANRTSPAQAEDSNLTIATVQDRSYPLGRTDVQYRAFVLTEASGQKISSAFTEVSGPLFSPAAWWLRCYDGTVPDVRLVSMDFAFDEGTSNEVLYVQNETHGVVRESGDAAPHSASIRAWLFEESDYAAMRALLTSKKTLYVQRNIGDGFFIHVTGRVSYTQKRAVGSPLLSVPRHLHVVDFSAEIVNTPKEILA